ncbi:MAG: BrnT family toxin [Methylococcales bacterium]|nr:BrnT family toxin [Methylococcales bacterium]
MKTKKIEWNEDKNKLLKQNRQVCFEDVEEAINNDGVLDIVLHHNQEKYSHQKILIVRINDYIHYVPFVEDDEKYFLKSIIPSRKHHSIYPNDFKMQDKVI